MNHLRGQTAREDQIPEHPPIERRISNNERGEPLKRRLVSPNPHQLQHVSK
jgi:hypothetical protein